MTSSTQNAKARVQNLGWHTIGWHDIVFEVPSDWNVTALSGAATSGYLRVDSPESLSFQVKWDRPSPPRSERIHARLKALLKRQSLSPFIPDVGVVLDHYEQVLRKQSRKSRHPLRLDRRRLVRLPGGQEGMAFNWRADRKASGWVWRCPDCRRVVIAEVVGEMSDPVSAMASRILPTLRDHPDASGHRWGLYDLSVLVPDGLHLESYKLMNVFTDLSFNGKPGSLWVTVWGLANMALKGRSLEEWFKANCTQRFRDYTYALTECIYRGHAAVRLQGAISGVISQARQIRQVFLLRPVMGRLEAIAWHCEAENKIFLVAFASPRGKLPLETVADSVGCHI